MLQESIQARNILFEVWRKLQQNRSQPLLQDGSNSKEVVRFFLGVSQPFKMSNRLRPLQHESKRIWRLLRPRFNYLRCWQLTKGVVDFDRGKMLRIEFQHLLRRKLLRIEVALPLSVTVPTCANKWFHTSIENVQLLRKKRSPSDDCRRASIVIESRQQDANGTLSGCDLGAGTPKSVVN